MKFYNEICLYKEEKVEAAASFDRRKRRERREARVELRLFGVSFSIFNWAIGRKN